MAAFPWFAYAFLFLFGAIIGSFLNALSFRFNTGRTLGGRSACMACGNTLTARDLVPVLSFLFLRGKCRSCKTRISLQYPLVEVVGGLVAVLCYRLYPTDALLFSSSFLIWNLLLFIAVYDLRHKIIPEPFSVAVGVAAFAGLFLGGRPDLPALLAGPVLALPLFSISFFSRGRAMGWGDGKLMLGLGWFLGLAKGFFALLFSFWVGALAALFLILPLNSVRRRLTMKSEIPYAPFLIIGAALAYFTPAADILFKALFF